MTELIWNNPLQESIELKTNKKCKLKGHRRIKKQNDAKKNEKKMFKTRKTKKEIMDFN